MKEVNLFRPPVKMKDSVTTNQSDPVLLSFLNSTTKGETEKELEILLVKKIKPVIEKTLRAKMHVSLSKNDFNRNNQDAIELLGEIDLLLISELRKLKSDNHKTIHNLNNYVISVTINAYRQYLRKKYPLRGQLKNKLHYLLTHHPEFCLWESERGWLCGTDKSSEMIESLDFESIQIKIMNLGTQNNLTTIPQTVELVRVCFEMIRAPILFNDLITLVAKIQGIQDQKEMVELEENPTILEDLAVFDNKIVSQIEDKEQLRQVWLEIQQMPVRHRLALLLNLKNKEGEGVINLFPILRIATIRQIAKALEFSPDEFGAIWSELPWEDIKIAEYMNLTRQQVINLRQSARNRLIRRLI